jgi:hypothetical protein
LWHGDLGGMYFCVEGIGDMCSLVGNVTMESLDVGRAATCVREEHGEFLRVVCCVEMST